MRVALYSRTPLAAAPWEIYKALKKYTLLKVSLINQRIRYADGRYFPSHLLLGAPGGLATKALDEAEIWHVHNYLDKELVSIKNGQKVVAQFHSLPRLGNWSELMNFADISYTIKQPLHEREYRLPGLPNLIDPDELRPGNRKGKIKIAFAPSSKTPVGQLDSKGYYEMQPILKDIAMRRDVEIKWIEGRSYETNLLMKQGAHIVIDDVVTGNWHRTSLEGMCFGCAVINKVKKTPFVYADLKTLKEKLLWLIDNPKVLKDYQERSRIWVLQNWHAMDLVKRYVAIYKGVLNG